MNSNEDSLCSCCGGANINEQAKEMGYTSSDLAILPEGSVLGLGCGNPTALAGLKKGEVVLDLGSGAGVDVFLASHRVGPEGKAIGVDMTNEMLQKSRENAVKGGFDNVEFLKGEIEDLPLDDEKVDVIISNCVINLTPNKLKAFNEAYRVLKHGGRILISDLVTEGELEPEIRQSFSAWSECIAGAMEKEEYLETIRNAGFQEVVIVDEAPYNEPGLYEKLKGKIISVQVNALK